MKRKTPRLDTRLQSEGAEFLVLGELLLRGIPAFKAYTNTPGYDIIATLPDKNTSARISVKSRWATKANGFMINNFDCDFVVVVKLNRGSRDGRVEVRPPEFFVFPVDFVRSLRRTASWGKITFKCIAEMPKYQSRWEHINAFLRDTPGTASRSNP